MCSKHTTFDYYEVHNKDANKNLVDDYFYNKYVSNLVTTYASLNGPLSTDLIGDVGVTHTFDIDVVNTFNEDIPDGTYFLVKYPKKDAFRIPSLIRDKCILPAT